MTKSHFYITKHWRIKETVKWFTFFRFRRTIPWRNYSRQMTIDIWGLNCLRNLVINKTFGFFHDILQGYRSSNPPNYIYNMSIRVRAQKQTFIALRVADLSSHPRYFEDGCFKLEWDNLPTFSQMRGAENNFSPRRSKYDLWSVAVPIFYTTPVARSIEARIGVFRGTVSRMLCPPYIFLTRVYVHVPAFTHSGQCESYLSSGMSDYEPP